MNRTRYLDILKIAVENEAEAFAFYTEAAVLVKDAALKQVFTDLAREEQGHKVLLEGYVNTGDALKFGEAEDYKVSETVDSPALTTAMSFVDAVALAMKKEEEAMTMYRAFAAASMDIKQKETFEALANMEAGHKAALEKTFVNIAYVEAW